MKRILLLLIIATSAFAQDPALQSIIESVQKKADADEFSGVLLIARDGKPVVQKAWGLADKESKTPNTMDTKFNIGSINKVFTKKAIEQLAAAGKLSLDDTIRKHLPDYPSAVADKITIRQLLDHKSGLGDIFGPRYVAAPPAKLRELSDFLPLFADEPLKFEPGTGNRYSNAGYVVLGLIIEKVSGMKYRDYVQKNIFTPAGMKDTGFWAVDENVPNRVTGYTKRGPDGPLPARRDNRSSLPGRPSSAGGAYATAGDLLRYFQWAKENGIGVGGGAPGLNAGVEVNNGWTVVAMANYDPPAAEEVARQAMMQLAPPRRGPSAPEKTTIEGLVVVPLTSPSHLMAVEAKMNGKGPYKFEIDTGAGGMMRLSQEIADELQIEIIGETISGDPSGQTMDRRKLGRVDTVEIGGAKFNGVIAAVGGRNNIIGLGLFGALTATLDFPKKELRLTRDSLPATGEHLMTFTLDHGLPTIDVEAGGVKVTSHIDSGSPGFFSSPPSAAVPIEGELQVLGHARTMNNEFDIKGGKLRGDLKIAGFSAANPMVEVIDIFPTGNVGSRFLRQYAVTFDMPNKRVMFVK